MLKDLVLKNRSYRGYDRSVKMTRDDLVELVELSRLSASSMNRQALKFHIADKEDEVAAIPIVGDRYNAEQQKQVQG